MKPSTLARQRGQDEEILVKMWHPPKAIRIALFAGLFFSWASAASFAQEKDRVGVFVEVRAPVTSAVYHSVRRQCETAMKSEESGGKGARILLFEFLPGASDFGNCWNLARYIESISGALTVAFVSRDLSGHSVMPALACDQILMRSDVSLGDIGAGEKQITPEVLTAYRELAKRRHPPYRAIIEGMLEQDAVVWKVTTARDTRYVLESELADLRNSEQIQNESILVDRGVLGKFNGAELRKIGLVRRLAEDRPDVAVAYGLSPRSLVSGVLQDWSPILIRLEGDVDALMGEFARRHIGRAITEHGANLVFIEIDSYGGSVTSGISLGEYLRDLDGVETVAYIPEKAISAATFIALGCDQIIMHRTAKLGNCGVWLLDETGQPIYLPEKQLSSVEADLISLAKENGYPEALVRGLIRKDLEVKEVRNTKTGRVMFWTKQEVQDRSGDEPVKVMKTVKEKGTFLTMDGETAQSLDFAQEVVDNFEGLLAVYGLEGQAIDQVSPNWVDRMIAVLTSPWAGLFLIVIGVLGLYLELNLPGVGIAGIASALAFVLFFWARFMGGTATTLEIVLFLFGIILLATEVLIIPGFGVFGISGIGLVLFSLVLASQDFLLPSMPREWEQFTSNVSYLALTLVSICVLGYMFTKYLPDVPILGRIVLQPTSEDFREVPKPEDVLVAAGMEGVAETALRPAGKVKMGEHFLDVVTQGGFVEPGVRVRVVEISGNRVVVEEA